MSGWLWWGEEESPKTTEVEKKKTNFEYYGVKPVDDTSDRIWLFKEDDLIQRARNIVFGLGIKDGYMVSFSYGNCVLAVHEMLKKYQALDNPEVEIKKEEELDKPSEN